MKWVDQAVRPEFSWPDRLVEIPFEGYKIVLQPLTEQLSCTVSLFDPNDTTFEAGGTILARFLSRLAWSKSGAITELFIMGSSNLEQPGRLGRGNFGRSVWAHVEPWPYLYLPLPATSQADLALALFREAMSLNSAPFAFLSFFKVLNIAYSDGHEQRDWINNNLGFITNGRGLDRLNELQVTESDIGHYLYKEGRCAVAHAYGTPLVNPDNYSDKRRLHLDLPLIRELAAVFIEREFGVLFESTFLQRHRDSDLSSSEILFPRINEDGVVRYGAFAENP